MKRWASVSLVYGLRSAVAAGNAWGRPSASAAPFAGLGPLPASGRRRSASSVGRFGDPAAWSRVFAHHHQPGGAAYDGLNIRVFMARLDEKQRSVRASLLVLRGRNRELLDAA